MIKFKEFILIKEKVMISNEEKLEMWKKVEQGEVSEDEFLKTIEFERVDPNSEIQVVLHTAWDLHITELVNAKDIHTKAFYNGNPKKIDVRERWREFDSKGKLTKTWDDRGNSEENKETIDDMGRFTETFTTIGLGKLMVKHIRIYDKEDTRNGNLLYYYYEEADGVKDERKYEYKYDEKQREIYKKEIFVLDNKVKETVTEYWDNNYVKDLKEYENGKLTKEESYTRNGHRKLPERLTKIAEKRAEEYNRKYHGIFVHSTSIIGLKNLLKIKDSNRKSEICISTLRANTVFQSGANNVVIVGFGNIKELYNYDSYSEREKDGSRYATKATDDVDDINLHSVRKDNIEGYDEALHYDEGFMDFSKADVVAIFVDYPKVIDKWVMVDDVIISKGELPYYYKKHMMFKPNVDTRKIKVKLFKTFIKKLNPNIKLIDLNKFNSLQNSEELMRLMYKIKDEIQDTELMDEPPHPYEESIKIPTFKEYILLNEWRRELMPDIYAALEKYDDPMVGVHFSKGVGEDEDKKTPHIGLNMNPFHHDPIGIYAFPKDYVLKGSLERNAGFRDLVNYYIVKPSSRANILNLSTMSEQDAIDILKKMGIGENAYHNQDIYHKSGKLDVGHRFWGTLEVMRKQIYGDSSKNVSWNNLFKKTGYNVLYDDGDGIIHSNEPTQIIYLESSAMEVLEQGTQDDPTNKIYSFFIKNFPELRPEKTKNHWDAKVLKLVSNKGYDLIILLPNRIESYSKIRVDIKDQNLGKSRSLGEFEMNGNLEDFVIDIKEKLTRLESEYFKEQGEREVPPVLEGISKRFNIKLKKDERGDWEIRQKYQDADKDYIITFYIRTFKDDIFFILNKKQKSMNYNTFGYNEAARVEYRERYTPEQIVEMGLKELEYQRYGSVSVNQDAMKTIEFLRKRVFGL